MRKALLAFAVVFILLILLLAGGWYWLTSSGRPQRSGEARLAGLGAPVEVRWDRWGVPHVSAASGADAAMALGWLHANDRMTQLELGRRAASGRLSEVVGEATVELDRAARQLRLRRAAEAHWQAAGPETREWLTAYAAGVNAWLGQRGDDLPPALRLLRLEPEPWTPVDSLCFVMLMARDLSFWNDRPEEERFTWLRAFGEARTRELLDDPGIHLAPEILALAEGTAAAPAAAGEDPSEVRDPSGVRSEGALGSNNWALGGSWTASGTPLVANDPHLPLALPAVWYQVWVHAPGYEAAGMTLPGLPGVVIGRTEHLAWALTNVMLDDHDVFFEDLEEGPGGPRVRRGKDWLPVTVETETLAVKGADAVTVELRSTDHGIVLEADPARGLPPRSLAWTAWQGTDALAAFLGLARATTLEEARQAVSSYVAPAQNLVVAHRDGGLMYTMLGRAPLRRQGDGRLPSPGWDPAYGWDGLRPVDEDPYVLRPAEDLLITANHDVRPVDYPYPFSADFDQPYRAQRIRQLLTARKGWQLEELAAVQADIVSLYALEVVGRLQAGLADAPDAPPLPDGAGQALAILAAWDGSMTSEGPAALFALVERHLRRGIFGDEARKESLRPFDSRDRLVAALAGQMAQAWFDDVTTEAVESRRETLTAALDAAWQEGTERWGPFPKHWPYGELHPLRLRHPLGVLPGIGTFFNRGPFALGGSATTVAAFGGRWQPDREGRLVEPVVYGPSMRWLADAAAGDAGRAVLPGGQSGHPWDPHYDDQLPLYREAGTHPVAWSEAAVEAAAVSRLRLMPAEKGRP